MKNLFFTLAVCVCVATAALGDELGVSSVSPTGLVDENLRQVSVYFNQPMRKSLLGSQGAPRVPEGELGVSHFSPSGAIGTQLNNITIHFTHAMIPLGEIKKVESNNLGIRIEPPIRGDWRWYGTTTWTFTAAETLQPSTLYCVTVPAGIRSVDGKEMRQSFAFEFETSPVLAQPPGIRIEPALAGRFLWQGDQGICFEIAQRLQQATRYRVTVPAGIRSFAGKSLAQSYTFELFTAPPYVGSCNPANESVDVTLEPDISLHFTQPVHAGEVGKYIGLYAAPASNPDAQSPLNITTSREKHTEHILVRAVQALPKESWIWVKMRSGWQGLNGQLPCDREFASRFRTYAPLRYETFKSLYTDRRATAPGDVVELYCNNPLASDFRRHIAIAPAPANLEGSTLYSRAIWLPSALFQYGQEHTITLSPGLTDIFGQKLGKTVAEKLYMFDLNPSVCIEPNGGRVMASSPRFVRLVTVNVPKLYLECYRADPERIFSPQVSIANDVDMYELSQKQYQKVLQPGAAKNQQHEDLWSFDQMGTGPRANAKRTGLFFLRVRTDSLRFHYERYEAIERTAQFVISDLGITARYGPDNILIFVASLQEGKPVAGAQVILRNKDAGGVWQGTTDSHGVALAPGKRNLQEMGLEPKVFVRKGDDMNYLVLSGGSRDGWISGYHYDPYVQYELPDYTPFIAYLYTDRGVYRPGHTVHLSGIFRRQDALSVRRLEATGESVRIDVQDARGKNIFSQATTVSAFDTCSVDIPIPANGPLGIYCANVRVGNHGSASKDFDVQEYRVSDFEASIQPDRPHFIQGEPVSVTISGKYLTGAPLTEAQVKWKLQVSSSEAPIPSRPGYVVGVPASNIEAGASGETTASLDAKGELKIQLYPVPVQPPRPNYLNRGRVHRPGQPYTNRPHLSDLVNDEPTEEIEKVPLVHEERPVPVLGKKLLPVAIKPEPSAPTEEKSPNPPGIVFSGGAGIYQIVAEVTAANRQAVTASGTFTVYPGPAYVGLRLGQNVIQQGSSLPLSVLAFTPDGQPLAGLPVSIKAEHVLKEEETLKLCAEKRMALTTAATPASCTITLPALGSYKFTAQMKEVNVSDTANAVKDAAHASSGVPVEIIPDREEYLPGQTAQFHIRSPYPQADGILCFERNDLVLYQPLQKIGAAHTLPCAIVEKMVPNAVAYLFLVRGARYSGAKNMPEFSSGRCDIKVAPVNRRLEISLKTNSVYYAPQDKVQVDIAVEDWQKRPVKSHMALMAVDEGVLTLTAFKTPDALFTFICPRPTWMATEEYSASHVPLFSRSTAKKSLPQVQEEITEASIVRKFRKDGWEIEEYRIAPKYVPRPSVAKAQMDICVEECEGARAEESVPAPAPARAAKEDMLVSSIQADSALAKQVAQRMSTIRIRKLFATTTYFNPAILTDENGKARASFQLPENLTSFRIMAVAVDHDECFGAADTRITVRKPLSLKVSLPRFAHVGDTFRAGVVVINQSGKADDVICSLKAEGIATRDEPLKKARLADGASLEIPYELKAIRPGDAKFTFAAFLGEHQDGVIETIQLKYPATTETFATYGVVRKQPVHEAVLPPDKVWPGIGGMDVTFAATAMTNLQDGIEFLLTYPYGCLEQTSSRLFPLVGLRELLLEFKVQGLTDAEIRRRIAGGVERICSMQKPCGGFSYWPSSEYANPWATVYALFVLLQVREAGHPVPPDVIDKAARYIEAYTNQEGNDIYHMCTDSLALVTLAISGRPNRKAEERLYENAKTLPIFAKAFLAYAHTLAPENVKWKARTLLQQILNQAVEEADDVHFKEEDANALDALMHTDIRTDAIVTWLMCHMEPNHLLLPKLARGIMKARVKGRWNNTQENAWALLALSKYLKAVEKETPDFAAVIRLGDKELLRQSFQGRVSQPAQASLSIDQLIEASAGKQQPVKISKEGPGILYYRLGITYAPARLDIPPMERGITVDRKYDVIEGTPVPVRDGEVWQYRVGSYVKVTLTVRLPKTRFFLAIDDPLPAGFEHVNEAFATSAKFAVGGSSFDHIEKRDDRALAFSDRLEPGTYQYVYVIRATTPGTYILPPAKVEEMYHPEVFGRSGSQVVNIVK